MVVAGLVVSAVAAWSAAAVAPFSCSLKVSAQDSCSHCLPMIMLLVTCAPSRLSLGQPACLTIDHIVRLVARQVVTVLESSGLFMMVNY